jgi:hypothetical protein
MPRTPIPYLFSKQSLRAFLEHRGAQLQAAIGGNGAGSLSPDDVLRTDPNALLEQTVKRFALEPLRLQSDDRFMDSPVEQMVDVSDDPRRVILRRPALVPGHRIVVSVPYTGTRELWDFHPSTSTTLVPTGRVTDGCIQLVHEHPNDRDETELRSEIDRQVKHLEQWVNFQGPEVAAFNAGLRATVRDLLDARRARIGKGAGLSNALGIPLKKKQSAPDLKVIRLERHPSNPTPPSQVRSEPPVPGISDQGYEEILRVLRHEGRTFEQTPRTFSKLDEEELRDLFVAHLNGYFEGQATGETFRRRGKTDIRIEERDRSAFVGECKVWRGAKEIAEACDQLLGYLTWRDCKAALIVLNKTVATFSRVLTALPQAIQDHPSFIRAHSVQEKGEWRFDLKSQCDPSLEVRVHVFAFHLHDGARESPKDVTS